MSDEQNEPQDVGDRDQVREARKHWRLSQREQDDALGRLMASPAGRAWMYGLLANCHIYHTSFSESPIRMAFAEGERSVGLRIVADLQRACPAHFNEMMQETIDERRPRKQPDATKFDPDKPFGGLATDRT